MPEPVKRGPGRPRKDGTQRVVGDGKLPSRPIPAAPPVAKPADPEPCEECFPGGWDSLGMDAYSAGCEHGVTQREIPA